ncbi:phage tail protein [Sphingobium sp. CR28]|uniref:phage tail protein n=1 Tax=Sphingobium sp. CR28 TaxID=3400272 RepID=UPI003FEDA1F7
MEASQPLRRIQGFACDGQDVRRALRPLLEAFDLRYREISGSELTLVRGGGQRDFIASGDQIARGDDEPVHPFQLSRRALEDVPARVAQRYYDPARDYQAGIQSVERPGAGRAALTVDLPATLDAGTARALADDRMRAALRGRLGLTVPLGWSALDLRIGDCVGVEDAPGLWRIERIEWSGMVVRLSLSPASTGTPLGEGTGAPGVAVSSPDREIGITSLALVELPADPDGAGDRPAVFAAATGAGKGWRGAALYRMDGDNARPIGAASQRAVIGTALDALPSGSATTFDTISTLVVSLARPGDILRSVSEAALRAGENLCMIGQELLQFGSAEPLGVGKFRISRLARGLQGTEWSISSHGADEPFVLVDTSRFVRVDLSGSARGHPLDLRAVGVGDMVPATAPLMVSGAAMTAPAPVHGTLRELSNGGLEIGWVRRSRAGWRWLDGADVPLGEETEAYRIVIEAGALTLRTATVSGPMWTYSAAERSADLALGLPTPVARVTQIGTWGEGRPLIIPL